MKNLGNVNAAEKCIIYSPYGKAVATCINTTNSIAYAMKKTGGEIAMYRIFDAKYFIDKSDIKNFDSHAKQLKNNNQAFFNQTPQQKINEAIVF